MRDFFVAPASSLAAGPKRRPRNNYVTVDPLHLMDALGQWVRASCFHQRMEQRRLTIAERDRQLLGAWIRAGSTPQRVARRARIVLLAADGHSTRAIADALEVNPRTAALWSRRYERGGPTALWRDAPGRGRRPTIPAAKVNALLASPPPDGARWTIRRLAEASGVSRASVHRVLRRAAEDSAP